jgi:hypothetical protein
MVLRLRFIQIQYISVKKLVVIWKKGNSTIKVYNTPNVKIWKFTQKLYFDSSLAISKYTIEI